MPFTIPISVFVNAAKKNPILYSPCSRRHGNDKGRARTKHDSQVLRRILRLHRTHEMDVKVTQLHQDPPAGPVSDSGIRHNVWNAACSDREPRSEYKCV